MLTVYDDGHEPFRFSGPVSCVHSVTWGTYVWILENYTYLFIVRQQESIDFNEKFHRISDIK